MVRKPATRGDVHHHEVPHGSGPRRFAPTRDAGRREEAMSATRETEALLPCPHCGAHPLMRRAMGEWWVYCPEGCGDMKSNPEAAKADWQRRAPAPPAPGADLERLRAEVVAVANEIGRYADWCERDRMNRNTAELCNLIARLRRAAEGEA